MSKPKEICKEKLFQAYKEDGLDVGEGAEYTPPGWIIGAMEEYARQCLEGVRDKVKRIRSECLSLAFDEGDDMEGVISEIDVKFCFDKLIEEMQDE